MVSVETLGPLSQPFDGSGIPFPGLNMLWTKNLQSRFEDD
jgi:hypothetical protein